MEEKKDNFINRLGQKTLQELQKAALQIKKSKKKRKEYFEKMEERVKLAEEENNPEAENLKDAIKLLKNSLK